MAEKYLHKTVFNNLTLSQKKFSKGDFFVKFIIPVLGGRPQKLLTPEAKKSIYDTGHTKAQLTSCIRAKEQAVFSRTPFSL